MDIFYRECGVNVGRGQHQLAAKAAALVAETRKLLLDLSHCPNKAVVFTPSATEAINLILRSVIRKDGMNIYLSPFEHNAVTRVVNYLGQAFKLNVFTLAFDRTSFTHDLEKIKYQFADDKPDLVVVSHASNVCGVVAPIAEICGLSKPYGSVNVIDMCQTMGLIDTNLSSEDIDYAVFATLNQLLAYIPPKSIGNMIGEFVNLCEVRNRSVQDYFDDFCDAYAPIRAFEEDYAAYQEDIHKIEEQLRGLESVGSLQAELSRHEAHIDRLEQEARRLIGEQGGYSTRQKDLEAQRQELANKDATNRKIETYKAYAQYMFDTLSMQYAEEESAMRAKLQEAVNELFQSIYNGGFSLSLDDKYNIQINVIDQAAGFAEDVETSTAQSISVIFAFIAGVIKMARQSQQAENAMLVSEPYPLVMDAPLSAFDKTRIQTVCEVLPAVAEQVIIFIKDTDGDLADTNLGSRVGKRYVFDKKNEFETYIV